MKYYIAFKHITFHHQYISTLYDVLIKSQVQVRTFDIDEYMLFGEETVKKIRL
jgi:hypothetical protein